MRSESGRLYRLIAMPSSDRSVCAVFDPNTAHSRGLSAVMTAHAELGLNYHGLDKFAVISVVAFLPI